MNEAEKMYENVLNLKRQCSSPYVDSEYCAKDCKECEDFRYDYPPFTVEKQLSLLKFCLKWGQVHILQGIDDEFRIENSYYRQGYQPTLEDAIANYINEKWQKLSEEERKQIKEILE